MNKSNFLGEFNKAAGYLGWQNSDEYEHIGSMDEFDEDIYVHISAEIVNILGEKSKYDIFEVAYYFKYKYYAFRIPDKYFWEYKDTLNDRLNAFSGSPFFESIECGYNPEDKNITMVIDTVFNQNLRKRYPNLQESDECNKVRMANEKHYCCRHENPIFILGTKDGKHLNSIYFLSGNCEIEDLNHEFYYFYKHS